MRKDLSDQVSSIKKRSLSSTPTGIARLLSSKQSSPKSRRETNCRFDFNPFIQLMSKNLKPEPIDGQLQDAFRDISIVEYLISFSVLVYYYLLIQLMVVDYM